MNRLIKLILVGSVMFCSGCSSPEHVYQGMYQGLHQHDVQEYSADPASAPIPPEQPPYDKYRREREEILRKDFERSGNDTPVSE